MKHAKKNTKAISKALACIVIGAMLLATLTGCGKGSEGIKNIVQHQSEVQAEPLTNRPYTDAAGAVSAFAIDWLKQNSTMDTLRSGENVMISPLSLYEDMGMLTNGASGDTLTELLTALHVEDLNQLNAMTAFAPDESLNIANSIWLNEEYGQLSDAYTEKILAYRAEGFTRPFNESTKDEINQWVSKKTNEMIPELLDSLDPTDVMHLLNAICFEGKWARPYEDWMIEDGTFTNSTGEKQDATMLYGGADLYFQYNDAQAIIQYYEGENLAFVGILPEEGVSLSDWIATADGQDFVAAYQQAYMPDLLYSSIPEFTFDYTVDATKDVEGLGVEQAFTGAADFSQMLSSGQSLMVSSIIQKTHIELTREGTRASAATDIAVTEGAMEDEEPEVRTVYLDRPFLFAIVDAQTGMPVFMGAVNTL